MYQKLSRRALTMWRTRLCLFALVPAFLSAFFFRAGSLIWLCLTVAWALTFLTLFVWYYPLKYHKLSYAVAGDVLVVNCGVIYTRRKTMLISNVQYVTLAVLPLGRLFGLCTVFFEAAGGRMHLPGVLREDGERLQTLLTSGMEEES